MVEWDLIDPEHQSWFGRENILYGMSPFDLVSGKNYGPYANDSVSIAEEDDPATKFWKVQAWMGVEMKNSDGEVFSPPRWNSGLSMCNVYVQYAAQGLLARRDDSGAVTDPNIGHFYVQKGMEPVYSSVNAKGKLGEGYKELDTNTQLDWMKSTGMKYGWEPVPTQGEMIQRLRAGQLVIAMTDRRNNAGEMKYEDNHAWGLIYDPAVAALYREVGIESMLAGIVQWQATLNRFGGIPAEMAVENVKFLFNPEALNLSGKLKSFFFAMDMVK